MPVGIFQRAGLPCILGGGQEPPAVNTQGMPGAPVRLWRECEMIPDLKPGLRHTQTLRVDQSLTVPAVSPAFAFDDMPPVFATAFMVGFIEWACIEALRPFLDPSERTVGTHVDVSHSRRRRSACPSPPTSSSSPSRAASCASRSPVRTTKSPIGEGFHERAVIDLEKFMARVAAKAV